MTWNLSVNLKRYCSKKQNFKYSSSHFYFDDKKFQIEKFPWMVMYQDGKQKEVFSQSRTMQNLLKFIHKHRIEHSKENGGQQRVEL